MNDYFLDRLVEAIPMLRRTCYRYVVDSNRADDLLQETLLKAIYNSDRYVENGKFHAWLSVIMANTYENCRKEAARMVTGIDCSAEGASPHCCTYIDNRYEYRNIIEQIRYLPPMYRTPFMLYVEGYKYEEIAEMLGIPVGTVKSRIFTARERLKAMLGDIY